MTEGRKKILYSEDDRETAALIAEELRGKLGAATRAEAAIKAASGS